MQLIGMGMGSPQLDQHECVEAAQMAENNNLPTWIGKNLVAQFAVNVPLEGAIKYEVQTFGFIVDVAPSRILVPHKPLPLVVPTYQHGSDQVNKHNGVHVHFYGFEFKV